MVLRQQVSLFALVSLLLSLACSQAADPTESNSSSTPDSAGVAQLADSDSQNSLPKNVAPRDGEDWPHFLGLTYDGVSRETGLLKKWPASGPPVLWSAEVGTGYSSPSIRGDLLVLHHRLEDEEIVEAMSASTGEPMWKSRYSSNFRDPYGYNNGPRCSPILTENHCFTLGAAGKLLCLKTSTGDVVWEHDLKEKYKIPDGFFGVGATPIIEGDKLIVLVGGQPDAGVVAFSTKTGKELWRSVGKATWDNAETGWAADPTYQWTGEEMVSTYSSPVAATIHGKRHVLCLMRQGLVSLDPESGTENFHYWYRSRTHDSVNAARPVVVGDTIMLSAAYRVGSALLTVNPDGKSYQETWRDARNLMTHWSTAIHHEGHYFGFTGRHENEGELRCLDAKTGDVVWSTTGYDDLSNLGRGPDGEIIDRTTKEEVPWPVYGRGSAILADGNFIVLAERGGTLSLVEANTKEFREISRCTVPKIRYPSWAAPVLSRKRLYLRSEDALVCLDLADDE